MQIRKNFNQLFRINFDGSIEPLVRIRVGGIEFGPGGIRFTRGVQFAGIDFTLFVGKDFVVIEQPNGVNEIVGIYK